MEREKRMAEIHSNFSEQAKDYDDQVRKIVPRYDEMLDALVSCIGPREKQELRAIDLGCGTGAASERLIGAYPETKLTCLDMTEKMMDIARQRLADHENVRYVLSDFHQFKFDGPYDVVISSLALHHIAADQDKKVIYGRIFEALAPGGVFYNADMVLGSDDDIQKLYMQRWKEYMYQNLPREEVDHGHMHRHEHNDSPAKFMDHMRWLEEAGFSSVDVVWKNYNFAVYGGKKLG
jgi:tRNA (cmo5U34)-methyltransferase